MNSAARLHKLLDSWCVMPGESALSTREGGEFRTMAFWQQHRLAMDWLEDIVSALDGLARSGFDVEVYRTNVPLWYAGVFAIPKHWTAGVSGPDPVVPEESANLLKALSGMLDLAKWEPAFPTDVANIYETLAHARELLEQDPAIDDNTRRYLLNLLDELVWCLERLDETGRAPARRIAMELVGGFTTVATTSLSEEEQKKWMYTAWSIAKVIGIAAVTKAIDAGGDWIGTELLK